ncbi:MAG: TauD/TfdA family dioxygenase [Pigmentiphaga sp.]|uniref:TauD/TfdA dioxygenase family protein n=1 Tax=Pigmentiphaga sp. TaxID=1977564 RepID=UPI0029A6F93D|nr:TauD/TfdA family dioxygenase [Pigmentiphaga sp.]MDX3907186.1 TauD/TfdA family dioxygenase [Pigmentiphaga sp.]
MTPDIDIPRPAAPAIEAQPLSPALGARVRGVDASQPLSPATLAQLLDLWHAHGVLCLPGQSLDELQQVRFGEYFGELATTQGEYQISKSHPAIMYITNEKENGEYVGALPDGEMYFHSDMCYVEKPSKATMLYAMQIPSQGGNTLFANMYKAYEALPAATRASLAGLKAVNSYEPGTSAPMAATRMRSARAEGVRSYSHPVVCTHPVTGRKALYVNRLMTEYIEGMPREESDALLESLFDFQERPEFIYEHRWTPGDLLIWDNRCMLHARTDFDASELRKLRRITVKGERIR